MLKDLEKELQKAEELDYQSAENYPWEYTQNSEEIFVADLKMLTTKPQFQKVEETLPAEPLDLAEQLADDLSENNIPLPSQVGLEQNDSQESDEEIVSEEIEEDLEPDILVENTSHLELDRALTKLEQNDFSWLFASLVLFFILAGGEWLLYFLKNYFFWSDQNILLFIWLWRLCLLIVWLYFAMVKKNYLREKIIASALLSFAAGVLALGIWKILAIKSVWTWLNLIVEPIWALLMVALVASLFVKIYKNN